MFFISRVHIIICRVVDVRCLQLAAKSKGAVGSVRRALVCAYMCMCILLFPFSMPSTSFQVLGRYDSCFVLGLGLSRAGRFGETRRGGVSDG